LWNYAYQKKILLISPTNLITTLKLISELWKRDTQNKNALDIADRGKKLYDKFVSFVEDFKDIDKHINKTQDSYNNAFNKLTKGRGNLISQAEKLIDLGVSPKKEIPEEFINNNDLLEEENE
jgi:DNA recombination protein RmuC